MEGRWEGARHRNSIKGRPLLASPRHLPRRRPNKKNRTVSFFLTKAKNKKTANQSRRKTKRVDQSVNKTEPITQQHHTSRMAKYRARHSSLAHPACAAIRASNGFPSRLPGNAATFEAVNALSLSSPSSESSSSEELSSESSSESSFTDLTDAGLLCAAPRGMRKSRRSQVAASGDERTSAPETMHVGALNNVRNIIIHQYWYCVPDKYYILLMYTRASGWS